METRKISANNLRDILGDIPELKPAQKAEHPSNPATWSFVNFKEVKGSWSTSYILETAKHPGSPFIENSTSRVKVEYDQSLGSKAKKWELIERVQGTETIDYLKQGKVSYDFGKVRFIYNLASTSLFVPSEKELQNPNNLKVTIAILSGDKPLSLAHPVARASFDKDQDINFWAQFAYGSFESALKGDIERLQDPFVRQDNHPNDMRNTYYQWEYLVGATLGWTEFEDERKKQLNYFRKVVTVNLGYLSRLDNRYEAKISYSDEKMGHEGRLRFSRRDVRSQETWMLSTPARFNGSDFEKAVVEDDLNNFFREFPVVFCVKRPGETREWFSTYYKDDRPH